MCLTCERHIYWGSEIREDPPIANYDEIMNSDEGVKHWTDLLVRELRLWLAISLAHFDAAITWVYIRR